MSSSPMLPAELEREIFEICSLSRPVTGRETVSIPTLMLIAKRVKEWSVKASPWDTPAQSPPSLMTACPDSSVRSPPKFFHDTARYLLLFGARAHRGAEDLSLFGSFHALIPVTQSLTLRRLQAHCVSMPPPTLRMSLQLTHLYLCGHPKDPGATCTALATLPSLTHLAVDNLALVSHKILELSPSIRVMVFFCSLRAYTDEVLDAAEVTRHAIRGHAHKKFRRRLVCGD
ncbi:hypothetical protein B0H14DRAFT_3709610 [Mycena olivaceomarginata]|nr:hypothetical protein B0H14DRAFT_3709610 [Mycena olivaceomarginata]